MNFSQKKIDQIFYYLTDPEPCDYLEHQSSRLTLVISDDTLDKSTFSELSRQGFRRSGEFIYKPACEACQQCLSCRIPVAEFKMNSVQKKAWKRNQDLKYRLLPSIYANQQHFELYCRYLQSRHADGNMSNSLDEKQFEDFLVRSNYESVFLEFFLEDTIIAVSVCDYFDDGLSAVYTFFDPDYQRRSLGVFAILKQIEYVKTLGLNYLYLGYWVPHSKKMNYKAQYQPLDILYQQQWYRLKQPLTSEQIQLFGTSLMKNTPQSLSSLSTMMDK